MVNPIPPITNELGRYWEQPDASQWLFDDTHVLLPVKDLRYLHSYDSTMPTGVYGGKMWQRQESPRAGKRHLLVWYGPSEKPGSCGIYFREILVIEEAPRG